MSINIDNYLGVHVNAVNVRAKKAKLMAENLANADTPGYKARDLDFRAALSQVQAGTSHSSSNSKTHQAHIKLTNSTDANTVKYRIPMQPALDGNTVETDVEQGKFTENAIRYQASLHFLNKRIKGLMNVLRSE